MSRNTINKNKKIQLVTKNIKHGWWLVCGQRATRMPTLLYFTDPVFSELFACIHELFPMRNRHHQILGRLQLRKIGRSIYNHHGQNVRFHVGSWQNVLKIFVQSKCVADKSKRMDQKMIEVKIRKTCDSFVLSSFTTRANLKSVALIICWRCLWMWSSNILDKS